MLKANQHFVLKFFGPPVLAGISSYAVRSLELWFEMSTSLLLIVMLVTFIVMFVLARWTIRAFVPVSCPYCQGRAQEMDGRGGRFMCLVCGRDH